MPSTTSLQRPRQAAGACAFRAGAFGVEVEVAASDVELLSDHAGHPSVRALVADGYEVITF